MGVGGNADQLFRARQGVRGFAARHHARQQAAANRRCHSGGRAGMADLSGGQVNHGSAQRVASPIASRLGMAMGPQEALASSGMGQAPRPPAKAVRSEEHTSELQSLMRNSYAVFCLKKKTKITITTYVQ